MIPGSVNLWKYVELFYQLEEIKYEGWKISSAESSCISFPFSFYIKAVHMRTEHLL
jgi:hypothetical protein